MRPLTADFREIDKRPFFLVHPGIPGNAALIFRKKYSTSRKPKAIRLTTLILLFMLPFDSA